MGSDARIERLRDLIAQIEQAPRSKKRDAVLYAVQDRIVSLDTGASRSSAWRFKPDDREVLHRRFARAPSHAASLPRRSVRPAQSRAKGGDPGRRL
jgi:hypothetical protein